MQLKIRTGRYFPILAGFTVFLLFLAVLTACGFTDENPGFTALLFGVGMTAFLLVVSARTLRKRNDFALFWVSFAVRLVFVITKFGGGSLAEPALSDDAAGFWRVANQYNVGNFRTQYTAFPYFLNAEFKIFGVNVLCVTFVNVLLTMIAILVIFRILDRFRVEGVARLVCGAMVCLMPYFFVLNASILRESMYFFFIVTSVGVYTRYIREKRTGDFYAALLLLVPALILHIGYAPIAAVYFIDFFRNGKIRTRKALIGRILQVVFFFAFVSVASMFSSVNYLTGSVSADLSGVGRLEAILSRLLGGGGGAASPVEAGSRYLAGMRIDSVPKLIVYSPIKMIFYLFSPLPINWRNLADVAAFLLDGVIHFMVVAAGFRATRRARRAAPLSGDGELTEKRRILWICFHSFLLCALCFGLGTSTAGTALRHRDVMVGVEALIVAGSFAFGKRLRAPEPAETPEEEPAGREPEGPETPAFEKLAERGNGGEGSV